MAKIKYLQPGEKLDITKLKSGSLTNTKTTISSTSNSSNNVIGENNDYKAYDFDGSKISKIKNSRTNHKSGPIAELHKKIDTVNSYVNSKHDVTAFIYFKVNDFELDTRSSNSFKHYAISMENTKTGVGQGNQFRIKIAYHKNFSNYSDINRLEKALSYLRSGATVTNGLDDVKTQLSRNECILQYGYLTDNPSLTSPVYKGLLLKYTVTANKQIVEYTLEGYTSECATQGITVNWYPNIKGAETVQLINGPVRRANLALKSDKTSKGLDNDSIEEFTKNMENLYSGGITFQPYLALDCFLQDYNASVSSKDVKYYLLDCTDGKRGKLGDAETLEPVHMSLCRGQTPIEYIEYCLGLFKYKNDNYALKYMQQTKQISDRFVYYLVNDPDNSLRVFVCVDVIDANISDNQVAYTFTGYTPSNRLMIDYNLTYDGTIALAVSNMYNDNENDNAIFIDNNGQIRARTSITNDLFVANEADDILVSKQNTWLDKISCANNCTMTTMGLPFEISVGTVFKCGIMITDVLHHSSGNCFVTGITDIIQNNTFTSQFTMIRLPGKNSAIKDIY